jgi:hypothetical protein
MLGIIALTPLADIEKARLFTATALTILVFITSCFYGVRTAELSNMRNAEANVYTYIQLAENAERGSRVEFSYRNTAIMWLVQSNRANDYQQKNCAFTIFWLWAAICMLFAFLFALARQRFHPFNFGWWGMWLFIILALVSVGLFFLFVPDPGRFGGNNWPENILSPLQMKNSSSPFLNCSLSHTDGFEEYIKRYDWLEPWLEREDPAEVWRDP